MCIYIYRYILHWKKPFLAVSKVGLQLWTAFPCHFPTRSSKSQSYEFSIAVPRVAEESRFQAGATCGTQKVPWPGPFDELVLPSMVPCHHFIIWATFAFIGLGTIFYFRSRSLESPLRKWFPTTRKPPKRPNNHPNIMPKQAPRILHLVHLLCCHWLWLCPVLGALNLFAATCRRPQQGRNFGFPNKNKSKLRGNPSISPLCWYQINPMYGFSSLKKTCLI